MFNKSTAIKLLIVFSVFVLCRYLFSIHYISLYVYIILILSIIAVYGYVTVKQTKK